MSTLYIFHNKKDPRVCFTHFDKDLLLDILYTLAAYALGASSKHHLSDQQKVRWLSRFEFSERIIEDN